MGVPIDRQMVQGDSDSSVEYSDTLKIEIGMKLVLICPNPMFQNLFLHFCQPPGHPTDTKNTPFYSPESCDSNGILKLSLSLLYVTFHRS